MTVFQRAVYSTKLDDDCKLQGRKNVEDSNHGSLEVLSLHFPGIAVGNYKNLRSGKHVSRPELNMEPLKYEAVETT
jgi:hypothetical protein